MKALRFHEFGDPAEVLRLEEVPTPEPAADEVLVRLTARSVNPSDLYTIMGVYGVLPKLPASPGNEGAGVVAAVGADVQDFKVGDRVILLLGAVGTHGTWLEYVAVKPSWLIPTPDALSDEQAACIWVNYLTAWILAHEEFKLQPNEPVLVSAGASHLGRALLQMSKLAGFKVVATVRREEQKQELLDLGALGVIATDTEDIGERWTEITGLKGIPKALDAVAGATGTAIAAALAPRGTMISYGLMSQEPIQIDGRMIFTEAQVRGFWLVPWLNTAGPARVQQVIGDLSALLADGSLAPAIDKTFDLTDFQAMLKRSQEPGRHGKVIITGPA